MFHVITRRFCREKRSNDTGEEIKAIGKVIRWGKSIVVCECDVKKEEKLVAKARGTFNLVGRK